jgi:predicted nucleic acid-binding protein
VSPLVVDASATLSWVFADEASARTDALAARVVAEGATVPWIWRLEVANVLLTAERRGRIDVGRAEAKMADLVALGIEVRDHGQTAAEIIGLARRHGLSSYDAAYLSLALAQGSELATLDQPLARAARAEGLVVSPESA